MQSKDKEIIPREADVQIDLIRDDIICRVKLLEDNTTEYACLMLDGVIFPRIKVSENGDGTYTLIDGRTRIQSYSEINQKMIPCLIYPKMSRSEILCMAFKCNYGIGQKMTFADARHTIVQLLDMGKTKKYITENLPYPPIQANRLYEDAYRNMISRKCAKAVEAMNSNPKLSSEDAASHFGIKIEQLKNYTGRMSRQGKKYAANHVKAAIALKYKSVIMFTAQTLKIVMDRLMSGEVSKEYANGILNECSERATHLRKNIVNWENRFSKVDQSADTPPPFTEEQHSYGYVMKPK